jgi:hypothetical protein
VTVDSDQSKSGKKKIRRVKNVLQLQTPFSTSSYMNLPKTPSWILGTAVVWITNTLHEKALAVAGKISEVSENLP